MLHSIVFQTLLLSLLSSCTEAWKPVVITSEALLRHQTKRFHPECPDRLANTLTTMREMEQDGLISIREPVDPNFDSLRVIKMVHDHDYVAEVEDMCNKGAPFISPWDTDTYINRDSFETVVTAQAAWINAVDDAMTNKRMNFALTRPPGHHASKTQSMGFCIFNFAAGAAFYAIEKYNLERVGILDFDVHFGNGVADLISPNPKIRYTSLHQEAIFPPNCGLATEKGDHNNILNIPLVAGTTWKGYRPPLVTQAIPFIQEFDPQLLIVCAGYDALSTDQYAELMLAPEDYQSISEELIGAFGNSIVFGLEGGYDLDKLPLAVKHTILPFTKK